MRTPDRQETARRGKGPIVVTANQHGRRPCPCKWWANQAGLSAAARQPPSPGTSGLDPRKSGTEKRDNGARRAVDRCSIGERSGREGDAGQSGDCPPVPHADGEGSRGPDASQANLQKCPQRGGPSGESRPRRKARGRTAAKQTKDNLRDKRPDPWPGANVLQKCMEPTPRRKRQPVAQFADAAEPSLGIPNGRRTGEMTLAKRPHSTKPRTG